MFHVWFRLKRPMTLGVRAMVVDGEGRLLLVRHTYTPGWHFPGGGVERGETAEAALAGELSEEAGLDMTGPPVLFGIYSNHHLFRNDHVIVYLVTDFAVTGQAREQEIAETGWFAPDALPPGVTAGTAARVAEWQGLRPRDAYWVPETLPERATR